MSKKLAAEMVAGLMMSHYQGPFDDGHFYYELMDGEGSKEQQEGAEYFDENKDELYEDKEFHKLVVESVAKELKEIK